VDALQLAAAAPNNRLTHIKARGGYSAPALRPFSARGENAPI